MTRIFVSVGEASGDHYAARVVHALKQQMPSVAVDAVAGRHVVAAGASPLATNDQMAVMGLVETLTSVPAHVRLRHKLVNRFKTGHYDLVLLVDYPGFNLSLAAAASRAGVPVLYYIAPQLWAWGEWRTTRLRKHVAALAVILPFEEPYFAERGVPATFVGHPLLDDKQALTAAEARRALDIPERALVLGLFPGSRTQEIQRLWPSFRDAARRLRASVPGLHLLVLGTERGEYPGSEDFQLWRGPARLAHAASDVGLCKSGTTTLEAALCGTPMVVAYRMHGVSYAIARRAVRVPRVGLVNLVAGRDVAPELIQDAATPESLARAALPLLDAHGTAARTQREGFELVRSRLGTPGAAQRVADMALTMVA